MHLHKLMFPASDRAALSCSQVSPIEWSGSVDTRRRPTRSRKNMVECGSHGNTLHCVETDGLLPQPVRSNPRPIEGRVFCCCEGWHHEPISRDVNACLPDDKATGVAPWSVPLSAVTPILPGARGRDMFSLLPLRTRSQYLL